MLKVGRCKEIVFPSPEVLHERAATHYDDVLIEPGNSQKLPRFDSATIAIETVAEKQRVIADSHGNVVGVRHWNDVLTADGIDRGVTTYVPDADSASGYPFSLLMDTAWYTGLEGHNDRIAEDFMRELGVPVVVIGPEFSTAAPESIGGERCLGRLALMCSSFSQMRSMEASAEIYTTLLAEHPEYGLHDTVVGVGESRGAMGEQIRRLQLHMRGVSTIHSDLTDPSVHRHALQTKEDITNLLAWPIHEAVGSAAVLGAMLRHGKLRREIATVPTSLRYHVGAALGTGPALLSGEEGLFPAFTPRFHPQHITNFKRNGLAHVEDRRDAYAGHPNTTIVELRGAHLGLGYPSVQRRVIDRTHQIGMHMLAGSTPDWAEIHSSGHRVHEPLPEVA